MLRGFVADPELGAGDREPGDHAVAASKAKDFDGAKGCFILAARKTPPFRAGM
jgi:hypothetical protein